MGTSGNLANKNKKYEQMQPKDKSGIHNVREKDIVIKQDRLIISQESVRQAPLQQQNASFLIAQTQPKLLPIIAIQQRENRQMKTLFILDERGMEHNIRIFDFRHQQLEQKEMTSPQCIICCHEIKHNGVQVELCHHTFHQDCLARYVDSQRNDRRWPITCPEVCEVELTIKELQSLYNSQQIDIMMSQINRTFLQNNSEFTFCPKAGCKYVVELLGDENEFMCYRCAQAYCRNCRTLYHYDMSCEQFRQQSEFKKKEEQSKINDQLFLGYVQAQELRQCPKCPHWIQRTEGCLHMTCICKYEFCFRCLGKYGQCYCGG